jgi:serine/threonine-protein kinase
MSAGEVLDDRFELLELLASPAHGKVFLAVDRELDRKVSLTLFHPSAVTDTGLFERLDSELSSLRRLAHPVIARTYDFGLAAGTPFLSQERVVGVGLEKALGRPDSPVREAWTGPAALRAARLLAYGLGASHGEGMAHGQLGPGSVVVGGGEIPLRISGFGVSVITRLPGPSAYRAPEQGAAGPASAQADVYSCGLLLVRIFGGEVSGAAGQAPSLPPGAPQPLIEVLHRCLAPEPTQRYPDARALAAALDPLHL